jgi:DNA-binding IclR family transcriptional regulator
VTTKAAPIKIFSNAVQLIEALAEHGPMSPAEIAVRIGIPRSSAYRLIDGLAAISLLENLTDGTVRLSTRWLRLADATHASMTEWAGAGEILEDLVGRTRQTAFLSVLVANEAVCIDWRRGRRGVEVLALRPGKSLPLYAGAAGRVMLAFGVDTAAYLKGGPFPALTPRTLVDPGTLAQDARLTRERGYALSEQDVTTGINAIGMPIFRPRGTVAGCVSIGGLTQAFDAGLMPFKSTLEEAAAAFTSLLSDDTSDM